MWRRDGEELFFVARDGTLQSVPARWTAEGPVFGKPSPVGVPPVGSGHWGTQFDISPDGTGIYLLQTNTAEPPRRIRVIVGWRALLDGTRPPAP